jgi:ribosomal protein S18 acetylase RimI-like enzyme
MGRRGTRPGPLSGRWSGQRRSRRSAAERKRALGFLADTDRAVAGEVAAIDEAGATHGWAVIDRRRPLVWDANYVWFERPGDADAAALATIADRIQGAVGLTHRIVLVADERHGRALTPGFLELGWHATPYVIMAHRHTRLLADTTTAREAGREEVAATRRTILAGESWATPEVIDQILERDAMIDEGAAGRCFGADCDGTLASHCHLWRRDGVAQVENVATDRRFRNRGLARAVVSLATATARAEGELVFLLADATDWPQHLYRRLGYESLGLLHRFCPWFPGEEPAPGGPGGDGSTRPERPIG